MALAPILHFCGITQGSRLSSGSDYFNSKIQEKELSFPPEMAWAIPQYSRSQVDAAGGALIRPSVPSSVPEDALSIINNWRSSHSFPLNTFQNSLRHKAGQVDSRSLVAQRIKRLSSIHLKLSRFPTMKLSQMQDIGGCRAVVRSVGLVDKLVDIYKNSDLKHELDHVDDYIRTPQRSGYRGIHLIYRYYSDKKETYNGLKIEMQFRSPLQHAWATAVETVGTFIKQALKASQGEKEWLRFFALMGTAIAIREDTDPVPATPTVEKELKQELVEYSQRLDVEGHLRAYGATLQTLGQRQAPNAHYFLLKLDTSGNTITIIGYQYNELQKATSDYLAAERAIANRPNADAVLVSVASLEALRRAYPNYFLDTHVFLDAVKQAIR